MNKKVILLIFSLIISSCSSGNENTIDELEQQILALEEKGDLTPEEELELNQLIEKQEEIIEDNESVYEEIEDEDEYVDLNDQIFSKYYVKNDPDPKFNPGKVLERHFFMMAGIKTYITKVFHLQMSR